MTKGTAAGLVALAAGIVALLWLSGDREPPRPAIAPAAERVSAPTSDPTPTRRAASDRQALARESEPGDVGEEGRAASPAEARVAIRGRVLDLDGTPVGGLELFAGSRSSAPSLTTSRADGSFEYEVSGSAVRHSLEARAPGWATVLRSTVDPFRTDRDHVVVVTRAVDLGGSVVDGAGRGLAGAGVTVVVPDELFARFPSPLDLTRRASFATRSSGDGRFRLENVPAPSGALVRAHREGYDTASVSMPSRSVADLVLELTRSVEEPPERIVGFVLKPDGGPAAGADVRFLDERTKADDAGAFELEMPDWGIEDDLPLVAALKGFGPALVPRFGEIVLASRPHPPAPVTLILGEAALEIAGVVVDDEGEPQRAWRVALRDFTEITRGQTPPELAEGLAGGVWNTTTGRDGRFVLRGLFPRSYRVGAYDPETLLQVESEPVPAGTRDVRLVVDADPYVRLRGRVESRTGAPVAGALVSVGLVTHRSGGAVSWVSADPTVTDADGRFVLERVPRRFVHLDVAGDHIIPMRHELEDLGPGEPGEHELLLSVARRCHLRVRVTASDLDGLAIAVSDANDERQTLYTFQGSGWSSGTVKRLVDGGMPISSVSEDVRTLHVLRNGEEVHRREIVLDPDEVTEIEVELP